MTAPKFSIRRTRLSLLGKDQDDWASYTAFAAPAIPGVINLISLGNKYLVSLGAHSAHSYLIMDRQSTNPLTVAEAHLACATLAFATDSPVVVRYNRTRRPLPDEATFSTSFRQGGVPSAEKYSDIVAGVADLVFDMFADVPAERSMRSFTRRTPGSQDWWHYPWPATDGLKRGILAYSQGLLSVLAPSRILNFWRVLEAVLPTRQAREAIFSDLGATRVGAVWTKGTRNRFVGGRAFSR